MMTNLLSLFAPSHSQWVAYRGEDRAGELIQFDTTEKIFNNLIEPRTLDYALGRFG